MPLGSPVSEIGRKGQTPVQLRIGVITTLKRTTLFMVLGLTTTEDDGHLRDQEQGENESEPPKSVTDPEADDKRNFWNLCQKKAGVPFGREEVLLIFSAAQKACGSEAAADCLKWINQKTVAIGADGTITEVVVPNDAHFQKEPDVFDQGEPPVMRWECLKCKKQFPVKPAQCECGSPLGCKPIT